MRYAATINLLVYVDICMSLHLYRKLNLHRVYLHIPVHVPISISISISSAISISIPLTSPGACWAHETLCLFKCCLGTYWPCPHCKRAIHLRLCHFVSFVKPRLLRRLHSKDYKKSKVLMPARPAVAGGSSMFCCAYGKLPEADYGGSNFQQLDVSPPDRPSRPRKH